MIGEEKVREADPATDNGQGTMDYCVNCPSM